MAFQGLYSRIIFGNLIHDLGPVFGHSWSNIRIEISDGLAPEHQRVTPLFINPTSFGRIKVIVLDVPLSTSRHVMMESKIPN
jgi:hypothetical protein